MPPKLKAVKSKAKPTPKPKTPSRKSKPKRSAEDAENSAKRAKRAKDARDAGGPLARAFAQQRATSDAPSQDPPAQDQQLQSVDSGANASTAEDTAQDLPAQEDQMQIADSGALASTAEATAQDLPAQDQQLQNVAQDLHAQEEQLQSVDSGANAVHCDGKQLVDGGCPQEASSAQPEGADRDCPQVGSAPSDLNIAAGGLHSQAFGDSSESMIHKLFRWPFFMLDAFCRWTRATNKSTLDVEEARTLSTKIVCELWDEGYQAIHGDGTVSAFLVEQHEQNADSLKGLYKKMSETSLSTAFSGIDTPATAFLQLGLALCHELKMESSSAPLPRNHYAVEWSTACQQELLEHPHSPDHLFTDISDFWHASIKAKVQALEGSSRLQDVLVPLVKAGKATMNAAWCAKHGRICQA